LKKIEDLQSLQALQNLENLKGLEKLQDLEKLKGLANFMPAEVKAEFIDEINEAIKEFEEESLDIQIDIDQGLIAINKARDVTPGSWNRVSPGVFAYVTDFNASSLEDAEINLPFGSITVQGTDSETATLTIQASGQVSSPAELEKQLITQSDINSSSAKFQIQSSKSNTGDENIHLQATLNIPSNTSVLMNTKAGHIKSSNISGDQNYQTDGGHISLDHLNGKIEARTSGGHITISDAKGTFNLRSFGGHIRAQDSEGNFRMKTSGGNLQAHNFRGKLDASTNGGNIEIRYIDVTGITSATTGAGTITIWVPSNSPANIDLTGNTVELDSSLDFRGEKSTGKATGSLKSGGSLIKAKTNYGKVILKPAN
ncbi:MAG: hypothetical protein WD597_06710, partial [Balneolaceae bacterium]